LRETLWFPVIETVHVIGIAFVLGTAGILDLRLIGVVLKKQPVSAVHEQLLPLTWGGFLAMFSSGILLVWSEPVKCYKSIYAPIKLTLLILAGLNALAFERGIYTRIAEWDTSLVTPVRAKMAGYFSLALWVGIVAAGRAIAYVTI
jgi:hypothetical protein